MRRCASADALRDDDKVELWLKKAPQMQTWSAEVSEEAGEGVLAKLKRFTKKVRFESSSQASRKPTAPTEEVGRLFFGIANCCWIWNFEMGPGVADFGG